MPLLLRLILNNPATPRLHHRCHIARVVTWAFSYYWKPCRLSGAALHEHSSLPTANLRSWRPSLWTTPRPCVCTPTCPILFQRSPLENLRDSPRSEEHTSELQSPYDLVC